MFPVSSPEVKTNVVAAYVSGGRSSEVPALLTRLKIRPRDSFDFAYNAACASIDRGDLPGAEELLLLAQRVGRETLIEEELPEEEVEDELTPLAVQLAFVQQLQASRVSQGSI
jgi:signal recognition particle subunit SRP72